MSRTVRSREGKSGEEGKNAVRENRGGKARSVDGKMEIGRS